MPCAAEHDLHVHLYLCRAMPRSISSLPGQVSRLQSSRALSSDVNNHPARVHLSSLGSLSFFYHSFFVTPSFLSPFSLASQEEITLTVYLFASYLFNQGVH